MNLSKHSWIYRYAYCLTSNGDKPHYRYNTGTVDLCRLFWRCVLLQPLKLGGIVVLAGLLLTVFFIVPVMKLGWPGLFLTPGLAAAAGLFSWAWIVFLKWTDHHEFPSPSELVPDLVKAYVKGIKENYCPIITITKE